MAVTFPVARGGAGVVTLLRERQRRREDRQRLERDARAEPRAAADLCEMADRKSTRLNSSHLVISYAVFCLKKKKGKHARRLRVRREQRRAGSRQRHCFGREQAN